jgi:hypothetical protein
MFFHRNMASCITIAKCSNIKGQSISGTLSSILKLLVNRRRLDWN